MKWFYAAVDVGRGLLCDKSHKKNNTEQASTFTVNANYSKNLNRVVYSSYYARPNGDGEDRITGSFLTCTLPKILSGSSDQE